jgi:hypothetical protein
MGCVDPLMHDRTLSPYLRAMFTTALKQALLSVGQEDAYACSAYRDESIESDPFGLFGCSARKATRQLADVPNAAAIARELVWSTALVMSSRQAPQYFVPAQNALAKSQSVVERGAQSSTTDRIVHWYKVWFM